MRVTLARPPSLHQHPCFQLLELSGWKSTSYCVAFLPHILWRFDGWNVLKDYIGNANKSDNGTGNLSKRVIVKENRADENVDWDPQHSR